MKPIVVAADGVALAMILLAVALSIIPRGPSSAEAEITPTRLQKKPRTTERLLKEDTESIRFRVNAFTMSNNWFDSNRDWLHGGRCEVSDQHYVAKSQYSSPWEKSRAVSLVITHFVQKRRE
jgi:hypothetical protein